MSRPLQNESKSQRRAICTEVTRRKRGQSDMQPFGRLQARRIITQIGEGGTFLVREVRKFLKNRGGNYER